jgi:poly(A) polymerase
MPVREFTPVVHRICAALPPDLPVYLVGGAVRDMLLGQEVHDLDFILPGNVLSITRRLADQVGAAFYPLDPERDYARLVLKDAQGEHLVLDFTPLQGPDLESDLRARDFTINAIAVDPRQPDKLLDPLGGAADLHAKRLRACSPSSFHDDPVRVLRAVRMAAAFGLRIMPESLGWLREAVQGLDSISPERLRDELFKILSLSQPATSLRTIEMVGALPYILPELPALKGLAQSPPHIYDVWEHTLDVLARLEAVLEALAPDYDPDKASSLALGLLVLRLGRYRQSLAQHLSNSLNPDRSPRALLFLAALYHDAGKAHTRQLDDDGRVRFFDHDLVSERLISERAQQLRLSNLEVDYLRKIVRYHMRPLLLAQNDTLPNRRVIYRFFRQAGEAGVEVCILSLADALATYGPGLPQDKWAHQLDVIRLLLEAWWEKPTESVSPPALLNGRDLIEQFGLQPGPQVGELLEAVREAQAEGRVNTRQDAFALVQELLN